MTDTPEPSDLDTLRSELAEQRGISKEDADLLLTATDPEQLAMQADTLAQKGFAKPYGPIAPREGTPRQHGTEPDYEVEAFTSRLFGRDPDENYTPYR
ncbi:MAG: hypothetical protein ACTHX2_14455 [Microbacterium sp.]